MIVHALAVSQLSAPAVDVLLEVLQKPTKFTTASALKNRLSFEQVLNVFVIQCLQ
jgi:hypothetical protein